MKNFPTEWGAAIQTHTNSGKPFTENHAIMTQTKYSWSGQQCPTKDHPGKHQTLWKNHGHWLLNTQSPGPQVHLALKSWSRRRSGSLCRTRATTVRRWLSSCTPAGSPRRRPTSILYWTPYKCPKSREEEPLRMTVITNNVITTTNGNHLIDILPLRLRRKVGALIVHLDNKKQTLPVFILNCNITLPLKVERH